MQKYKNVVAYVDGIRFPSQREANRYRELSLLQRAGKIHNLRLQVSYELIPAQYEVITTYTPKKHLPKLKRVCVEKSVVYIADFVYTTADGAEVVEDAKGCRTEGFIIKKKLMRHIHGIKVHEV